MGIALQLMVIGDSDLPAGHRWAILRPRNSEPVLAVKEEWSRDIRTLTEALAALPALTADDVEGAQRFSLDAHRLERVARR